MMSQENMLHSCKKVQIKVEFGVDWQVTQITFTQLTIVSILSKMTPIFSHTKPSFSA